MDPTTIISLIGMAYSVAKGAVLIATTIHKLKSDVKDFDGNVEAFVSEIAALGHACEVVRQRLEVILDGYDDLRPGSQLRTSHSEHLWTCLQNQIGACEKTVQGLQKTLGASIASLDKDAKFTEKVIKQLNLYLKVFDIKEARERIRSHTASLQIVLLSIGIEISYLVPQRIDQ